MKRTIAAAGAMLLAACGDGSGPTAGELRVQLSGVAAPRALIIEVVGPHQDLSVPAGLSYSTSPQGADTIHVALVADQGSTIANGSVITLSVENVDRAGRYSARVLQAAGGNYALMQTNTFVLSVAR